MSAKDDKKQDKEDHELSDLLESALKDFSTKPETSAAEAAPAPKVPAQFSEDLLAQAAQQFEANFANLLSGGDPEAVSPDLIQEKLKQMAEAAQQVLQNPQQVTQDTTDIGRSISAAIQGLNEGAEGLQNPFSEDDLMKLFGNPQSDSNTLLPFMQGMMQGLLSKEVLAPSLKDFVERLPQYLEDNKDKISEEDRERYLKQKSLMETVLEELDKEGDAKTPEEEKEQFSRVLALMQKLQEYGQPPADLVGEVDAPFDFDAQGVPAQAQDCSLM